MRVQVLGDLEVVLGDRVADLGGPKPRTLLALLVAAGGRAAPVEYLINQIWGEDPPARVETSLQSYVARLRKALDRGRPAERLRTHAGGYSLDVTADEVDARRFDDLAALRRAREHLADELGVDPGLELRRVEELVLRQDSSLDVTLSTGPVPVTAPAAERRLFGRDDALA